MKSKTFFILFCFVFLFPQWGTGIRAQGGSNYSVFGIGDVYSITNATFVGLSGTSIAFPSEYSINTLNPAMWSFVTDTRLQGGYLFNQHIVDDTKFTLFQNNGKLNGMLGLFSVDTALGFSISFGLFPVTSVNYYISTPIKIEIDTATNFQGITYYQGSGGITRFHLGVSTKLFNNLSVGLAGIANFGNFKHSIKTYFYDTYSFASITEKQDFLRGWGLKGGLYWNIFKGLSIGAFYDYLVSNELNSDITLSTELIADTSYSYSKGLNIGNSYGIGLSYRLGKFVFGTDFILMNLSKLNYQEGPHTSFRDYKQFSIGVSRLGEKSYFAHFLDKITYNFGICYKSHYYKILDTPIEEYSFSLGMEIPIVGTARVNPSFVFGVKGTNKNGLLKEYFGRFVLDISIGDTWFKPFKREY